MTVRQFRTASFLLATVALASSLQSVAAKEPPSFADLWFSWDGSTQAAFITGYRKGLETGAVRASKFWEETGYISKPPSVEDRQRLRKRVHWEIETSALVDGMTTLYRDAANVYIMLGDAISIAAARLQGEDVEKQLRDARKKGLEVRQTLKDKK